MTRRDTIQGIEYQKKYVGELDNIIEYYHQERMRRTLMIIHLEEQLKLNDLVHFCNTGEYPVD